MKNKIIILIVNIIALLVILIYTNNKSTDLEIYTYEDIIYVNDNTVTFENTNEVYTFKDKESLKLFIANKTIEQINLTEPE